MTLNSKHRIFSPTLLCTNHIDLFNINISSLVENPEKQVTVNVKIHNELNNALMPINNIKRKHWK